MARAIRRAHDDAGDLYRHPRAVFAPQTHFDRAETSIVQQRFDAQRPLRVAVSDLPVGPFQCEDFVLRIPGDHLHRAVRLQKPSVHVVERNAERRKVVEAAKLRFADAQLLLSVFARSDVGYISVPHGAAVVEPARHSIALDPAQPAVRTNDAMVKVPRLQVLS